MEVTQEEREFLTTRRAKATPADAGLPAGPNRRVPGLRRAEVAMLADVSVEYYARLERGNLAGVSEAVLDSIARALQLDEPEREHLNRLAALANRSPQVRRGTTCGATRSASRRSTTKWWATWYWSSKAWSWGGDPGLHLTVYTPEPASPSAERLALLASWAATQDATAAKPAAVDRS